MTTFKINSAGLVEPHGPSANKINRTTGALGWSQLEGTRRIYQLNPVALAALRDQLDT